MTRDTPLTIDCARRTLLSSNTDTDDVLSIHERAKGRSGRNSESWWATAVIIPPTITNSPANFTYLREQQPATLWLLRQLTVIEVHSRE
jgi:hypothetical protein